MPILATFSKAEEKIPEVFYYIFWVFASTLSRVRATERGVLHMLLTQ